MKKAKIFGLIVFLYMAVCIPLTAQAIVLDDFEGITGFKAIGKSWGDGDQSTTATKSSLHATSGTSSLECKFNISDASKGATYSWEGLTKGNWSTYTNLVLDVFNPTNVTIKLAISISTGDDWLWQESPVVELAPGLNRDVTFSLTKNIYKSPNSNWANTGTLSGMKFVKRLVLKLFSDEVLNSSIFVDNIRLTK